MADKDFKVKNKLIINGNSGNPGPLLIGANNSVSSTPFITTQNGGTGTSISPSEGQILYSSSGSSYSPTTSTSIPGFYSYGNTASRPTSPFVGQIYINTETNLMEVYTSLGWSQVSIKPNSATIGTATDVGTNIVYGSGSVDVAFTSSNTGGLASLFTATSTPGNITAQSLTSPIRVSGLSQGTAYTFKITASNIYGNSAESSSSNSVTPTSVPQAPTIGAPSIPTGQSFASTANASVAFTGNANGGKTITSYTVTSSPGNITATGASSPITITGLTRETPYTFTVKANNSNGASLASSSSSSITPTTIPQTISAPTATNQGTGRLYNNGQASISFSIPSNGGQAITGYTITSSPGGFTGTGASSPITITGLQSNTSYTFTATATNSNGTSTASASSNSIIATTVPQAPTIGTATTGNGQASVTFTANATGGSSITSYTVTSSPGNITASGASSPITVTGLTNGTAYTFTVTATNANGTSAASAASNSITPAAPVPGTSFTVGTLPVSAGSSYGMTGAGPYIFLSGNSATYYTTTNGSTWTSRTFPSASGFTSISFYNNIYVAVGGYTSWSTGTATYYTSTDLVTWTSRTLSSSQGWAAQLNYITTDGSRHVMIAKDDSNTRHTFFVSTDGINWTEYVSVAVNSYSSNYRISPNPYYINGNWVISFRDNSQFIPQGIAYTSNLAGSWTRYTQSPSNAYLYPSEVSIKNDYSIGITSGNGGTTGQYRYFTAPNSYTYSSALGTTWQNTPPRYPHQSSVFLMSDWNNINTWYRSTNATSWTSYSLTNIGSYLVSGGWACSPTSGIITGWSWSYSQTGYIYSTS